MQSIAAGFIIKHLGFAADSLDGLFIFSFATHNKRRNYIFFRHNNSRPTDYYFILLLTSTQKRANMLICKRTYKEGTQMILLLSYIEIVLVISVVTLFVRAFRNNGKK